MPQNITGQVQNFLTAKIRPMLHSIIVPMAEVVTIFLISYFILLITRFVLVRLQRREVFTAAAVERIHRLLALVVYSIAFTGSLYIVTNIHEIIYFFMAIFLVILAANWKLIASITAYYIMLLRREAYRTTLLNFPRLGIRGKIVNTSLLYTKLRTPAGRIVYIPNYITISEPVIHLVNIQTNIRLEVEITLPDSKPTTTHIEEIAKRIQQRLDTEHLVTRAKDVTIRLVKIVSPRATFIVDIPVAGYEPRPATVNQIIAVLAEELKEYEPHINLFDAQV